MHHIYIFTKIFITMRLRSHLWNDISHYQWIGLCMSWEFNWVCWSTSNNTVGNFFLNVYFFLSNENGLLNDWTCPKLVQTRYALNKWWEFKSLIIYIKHKLVGLRSHQVIIDFALSYWQLYLCFYLRLHSSNILFLATLKLSMCLIHVSLSSENLFCTVNISPDHSSELLFKMLPPHLINLQSCANNIISFSFSKHQ